MCRFPSMVCLAAMLWSSATQADLALMAETGAGYSDNITRVPSDPQDETIGTVGLQLDWAENTRRLQADVTADLSYYEYLDDAFDSEVVGIANGLVQVGIVPETLTWIIQDTFGQAQSDPFAPVTPETRENLNYFTTGPDWLLHFGGTGFARLYGRYSATEYETSPLDAERNTAGFALGRRPSTRSEITLNGVIEEVGFDEPINPDYDRKSAFFGYRVDASRTLIETQLGYTWLDRDGDPDTQGSALVDLTVTRDLTASSLLQLTLGTQLGDAGDALRGSIDSGAVGGGSDITASADPFTNRVVSLQWRFSRNRTGLAVGAAWNEDEYETQTQLNRTRYVYDIAFNRQLGPTLGLELLASLMDEEFENLARSSDELRLGAALTWQAGRRFGLRLRVEHHDRDTSLGIGEYRENRYFLTATYRLRGQAPGAGQPPLGPQSRTRPAPRVRP